MIPTGLTQRVRLELQSLELNCDDGAKAVSYRLMNSSETAEPAWRRSRYGFALFHFVGLLVVWLVLRAVLFIQFKPAGVTPGQLAAVFLSGLQRDFFVALAEI